jgi:hypothetical protein
MQITVTVSDANVADLSKAMGSTGVVPGPSQSAKPTDQEFIQSCISSYLLQSLMSYRATQASNAVMATPGTL